MGITRIIILFFLFIDLSYSQVFKTQAPNVRFGSGVPVAMSSDKENDTYIRTDDGLYTGTFLEEYVYDKNYGVWVLCTLPVSGVTSLETDYLNGVLTTTIDGIMYDTAQIPTSGSGSDNQKIDTFTIVSNTLRLSLEDDAEAFKTVSLAAYLDNTDAQTLTWTSGTGNLDISGGNTVNLDGRYLTSEVDGSTTNEIQTIDTFAFASKNLKASLLNDGVAASNVYLGQFLDTATAHSGDVSGIYSNLQLGTNVVTSTEIGNGEVSALDLADSAVTELKLISNSVGTTALKTGSVTTLKLADSSVTAIKVLSNSIDTTHLKSSGVTAGNYTLSSISVNSDGIITAASSGVGGSGDMVLASTQTITGAKTFNDTKFLLQNVANTFNGSFVNTNTANRIYTLKDAAGTLAFVSDITGTNSGTNTGDQTSIVGLTGTLAEFNTAVTDADLARTDAGNTFTGVQTMTSPVLTTPSIGVATGTSLNVTDQITSSGTAGVGYSTGAGGTVTQLTNKTTGVTLNKTCGQITMNGAALAAAAEVSFILTNSTIAATDVIVVNVQSVGTAGAYLLSIGAVAAGSCRITVSNASAGSLSQAIVLSFVVIKGVTN